MKKLLLILLVLTTYSCGKKRCIQCSIRIEYEPFTFLTNPPDLPENEIICYTTKKIIQEEINKTAIECHNLRKQYPGLTFHCRCRYNNGSTVDF